MIMFRRPIKEINAEFSAEEKYLDSIQRTVRDACAAAGLSGRDTSAVLLALEEGATNIIRHAYLYEKGVLRLRIVIYRRQVVFSLIDFGRSFQPDHSKPLDLEHLVKSGRRGGLGFYMIQKIMDSVEYISASSFNELRMIKRIASGPADTRPLIRRMFTLRVKFSFWTFLVVSIIIGGSYYYLYTQTAEQASIELNRRIASLGKTIADQAAGYHINRRSDVEYDELVVSYLLANPELERVVITDINGHIRAHSEDIHLIGEIYEAPVNIDVTAIAAAQSYQEDSKQRHYLIVPIGASETVIGMVHMTYTSGHLWKELAVSRLGIIVFTLTLLVFGIFGIYLLSNYFVRPIVKITQRVRRFAKGDLESELPLEGAEEFFEISRAFNEMMLRVSQDKKNIIAREKMTREIEVASHIQRALLPSELPSLPGLEIDAFYRAASVIGGDLYDVFKIGPDRYCLVVADVSGKGVPASLVMSMLRTVIQIHAAEGASSKSVLTKVNSYLQDNIPSGMFVTLMMVIYDASRQKLNLVSAGHNPMLYYHAGAGDMERINPAGMPMGVPITDGSSFEDKLHQVSLKMEEGDAFLIFTDGIPEAVDRDRNQFGMDRLSECFRTHLSGKKKRKIGKVTEDFVSTLEDFVGFTNPADDMTFVIGRSTAGASSEGKSDKQSKKPNTIPVKKLKSDSAG